MTTDFKFAELTLENAGQGALKRRFQECLAEAVEIFAECEDYAETKGKIRVRIAASVSITLDVESKTRIVEVDCDLRRPRRRSVSEAAFVADGVLMVQPELEQRKLFPLPTRDAKEGGE